MSATIDVDREVQLQGAMNVVVGMVAGLPVNMVLLWPQLCQHGISMTSAVPTWYCYGLNCANMVLLRRLLC